MPLPPDMDPPPLDDVPPARRDAYLRDCLTWPSLPQMPWMRLAWLGSPDRSIDAGDGFMIEARVESGRHVQLVMPDHAARKLLRALRRALPDEPLDPSP